MSARRYNIGKPRYDLIPKQPLKELAEVYRKGAAKYTLYRKGDKTITGLELESESDKLGWEKIDCGENNWRRGFNWTECMASVERHIQAWYKGEDIDPDLGTHHLGNAAFGLFALMEFQSIHPEMDNRNHWFKKKPKRVGLDIDGVLASFEHHFLEYLALPLDHPTDWDDPRFRNNYQRISNDKEFWLSMPTLVSPEQIDYPIAGYCTARSCDPEVTKQWLEKHRFPAQEIISVGFGESKVDVIRGKFDVFIDDSIRNFIELQSNGILCYLKTRPHNVKFDVGHFRVDTIEAFTEKVRSLA